MGFQQKIKRADGRAYGAFLLTTLAVLTLTLFIPVGLNMAAGVATSADSETKYSPLKTTAGGGFVWSNFTDGVGTSAYGDCTPYHYTTVGVYHPDGVYPTSIYAGSPSYAFYDQNSDRMFGYGGNPFRDDGVAYNDPLAAFYVCDTENDELGVQLVNTFNGTDLIFSTNDNLIMTKFNASFVKKMVAGNLNNTVSKDGSVRVNYSWHIEINGDYAFGETVRAADNHHNSFSRTTCYFLCTPSHLANGNGTYYPTIAFEHSLSIDESYRVRQLLIKQDVYSLDVRLFFTCEDSSAVGFDCLLHQNGLGNYADLSSAYPQDSFHFGGEAEYVVNDDFNLLIKGVLVVLAVGVSLIAVASTPAWNPLKKMAGDFR